VSQRVVDRKFQRKGCPQVRQPSLLFVSEVVGLHVDHALAAGDEQSQHLVKLSLQYMLQQYEDVLRTVVTDNKTDRSNKTNRLARYTHLTWFHSVIHSDQGDAELVGDGDVVSVCLVAFCFKKLKQRHTKST